MDRFTLPIDGGTQPRERLDEATVERYAEAMAAGLWDFGRSSDPAVAFYDGTEHWLSDGFHGLEAAKRAGKLDELSACLEVRQGTVRDAILYSVGANAHHGFPRSDDDKRRAVLRLLDDSEWSKWSDREIARRCSVAPTFVGKLRASLSTVDSEPIQRTYTTKHGTVAAMDTRAIGRSPKRPNDSAGKPADHKRRAREEADRRVARILAVGSPDEPTTSREVAKPVPIIAEPVGELHAEPIGELRAATRTSESPDGSEVEPPDEVDAERVTVEPAAEHDEIEMLAGLRVPLDHGKSIYLVLKQHLEGRGPRPKLPPPVGIAAMTGRNRATIRRLAEQSRAWVVELLDLLDKAEGGGNA